MIVWRLQHHKWTVGPGGVSILTVPGRTPIRTEVEIELPPPPKPRSPVLLWLQTYLATREGGATGPELAIACGGAYSQYLLGFHLRSHKELFARGGWQVKYKARNKMLKWRLLLPAPAVPNGQ